MPNVSNFEVEFTREQIQAILDNGDVQYLNVSGSYTYRPDLGQNVWEMDAAGYGCDSKKEKMTTTKQAPCIKPC